MHLIVSKLTKYCINTKLIQAKYAPWLQYSLEKRITLIFTLIPFFLLAVYMTSLSCALSFYISFYLIRSHASGFHMKTAESCIIVSLAMEFLFFKTVYPLLNNLSILLLTVICSAIVFLLAPYKDTNMNFTDNEVHACRKSSRIRICIIAFTIAICTELSAIEIAKGSAIGTLMATFLLCFGYLNKRRK